MRDVTSPFWRAARQGGLRDTVDARVKVVILDPPIPRSLLSRLSLGRAMAARMTGAQPRRYFPAGKFPSVPVASSAAGLSACRDGGEDFQSASTGRTGGASCGPSSAIAPARSDGMAALSDGLCARCARSWRLQRRCGCCTIRSLSGEHCTSASLRGIVSAAFSGRAGWSRRRMSALALKTIQALNRLDPVASDPVG